MYNGAIIISAILAGLVLVLSRRHREDPNQLASRRANRVTLGVLIVCGDCSTDEQRPVKTYLDRSGHCEQCGGSSYMLASAIKPAKKVLVKEKHPTRVLAFGKVDAYRRTHL